MHTVKIFNYLYIFFAIFMYFKDKYKSKFVYLVNINFLNLNHSKCALFSV